MSHLKEKEFAIRNWCRDRGLTADESILLVDVCLDESEEIQDLKKKQWLLQTLEEIYIREAHPDERIRRLCLIAKELCIKLSDMESEDVVYMMKSVIDDKGIISGIGGLLDSFWQENEIVEVSDKVIQSISRARHLKFLEISF